MTEPPTVLVADPCPVNADSLAHVLAACGYRVRTAATAAAALAIAAADPPDVLITESLFPDLDGARLAEHVAAGRTPRPRLVLLTSRPAAGGWPGFDRVYVKPADPEDLVRRVGSGRATPAGHAAGARVDPS